MRLESRQERFIGYLLELAREGQENRGALAELRSGLGKKPGEMSRVHRHVVPFLPEKGGWQDRWYYLIATLFGFHPMHQDPMLHKSGDREWRESLTVGGSFGCVWREREHAESIEARFIALLNADADDLGDHLRHVISLLKAHDMPLDWRRLFSDVLLWDDQERKVQKSWARHFYRHSPESRTESSEQVEEEKGQEV